MGVMCLPLFDVSNQEQSGVCRLEGGPVPRNERKGGANQTFYVCLNTWHMLHCCVFLRSGKPCITLARGNHVSHSLGETIYHTRLDRIYVFIFLNCFFP